VDAEAKRRAIAYSAARNIIAHLLRENAAIIERRPQQPGFKSRGGGNLSQDFDGDTFCGLRIKFESCPCQKNITQVGKKISFIDGHNGQQKPNLRR